MIFASFPPSLRNVLIFGCFRSLGRLETGPTNESGKHRKLRGKIAWRSKPVGITDSDFLQTEQFGGLRGRKIVGYWRPSPGNDHQATSSEVSPQR